MRVRIAIVSFVASAALALGASVAGAGGRDRSSIKDDAYHGAFNWSGFYIGAHLGGAWSTTDFGFGSVANGC